MSAETELIFQDLPSDFDPLGLMQTCPELYVDSGASISYNFHHFTIQEYLAAYYISQQSRDEQVAFMRECIKNEKLEVVGRFLAGLCELGQDLWEVVRQWFLGEDEDLPPGFIFHFAPYAKLHILHWLFESQDRSVLTSIIGSNSVCFSDDVGVLPFDLYILGYCIAQSSCGWKLELRHCELESVKTFLNVLHLQQDQFQLPSEGHIKQMVFLSSDPKALHLLVTNIPQMSVFRSLTHLSLLGKGLCFKICDHLCEHTDLLRQLLHLNLNFSRIGRGDAVNLITSLTKFSNVRKLGLHGHDIFLWAFSGIGFEDCKALSELLTSSKYIEVLDIENNSLSPDSIQLIIDGLSQSTSLEKLLVGNSHFSSENVLSLASVLRVNTRLKELDMKHCNIQSSDSVHLAEALNENIATQLQSLRLSHNPIGSEGAAAFADMLATNKSLTSLNMDHCSIKGEGALALAKMLKKNQCLKLLLLTDGSVGAEGALILIESLQWNTTLVELHLSDECKPPSFPTLDAALQKRVKFRLDVVS